MVEGFCDHLTADRVGGTHRPRRGPRPLRGGSRAHGRGGGPHAVCAGLGESLPHDPAVRIAVITAFDIGWLVGFIEGEGSFSHSLSTPIVSAVQVNPEPVLRLVQLFGGRITTRNTPNGKPFYRWYVSGPRAVGLIFMMWSGLSEKRRGQAQKMLALWRLARPSPRYRTHCLRGHSYAAVGVYRPNRRTKSGTRRRCRICEREDGRVSMRRYHAKLRVVRSDRQGELPIA